jgi:MFS transporter, DHA1 family, inner membrane transport protein
MGYNFHVVWMRIEEWLVGSLDEKTRYNMRVELSSQIAYGVSLTVLGFLPLILAHMGASVLILALYSASTYLGNVLASFALFLIRPGRTRRVVIICWLVSRSLLFVAALITHDVALLILAAFFWLADQLPNPAYSAIIQSIYPSEDRGKVLAAVRLGTAIPLVVLTPIVGWGLDRTGPSAMFVLAAVAGLVAVFLFSRMRIDEAKLVVRRTRSLGYVREITRNDRRFVLYLSGLVVFGLSALIASPLYPIIQAGRLHLSYEQLGWLTLLFSAARILSYFYWGRRIDRWGSVRCLQIAFAIQVIIVLPYIWAASPWMLVPSFIALGINNSAIDLGFVNTAIQLADPQRVSQYTALQYTVIGVRGIIGPLIGVGLLRLGVPAAAIFVVSAVLALVSAVVLGRVNRLPAPTYQAVAVAAPGAS